MPSVGGDYPPAKSSHLAPDGSASSAVPGPTTTAPSQLQPHQSQPQSQLHASPRWDDETHTDQPSRPDQTFHVSSSPFSRNDVNPQQTPHGHAPAAKPAAKPAKPPPPTKPRVPAKKPALAHLEVDNSTTSLSGNLTAASTESIDRVSPFSTPP
ncbi:hypothetical protein KEM56_005777, partial [Ascosphaera pollenicola]